MILRNIEGRRTIAASSFFPDRSRLATRRSYSLEKAKEYLKKSTYNGETIHIYFFAFKDSANDAYFLKERCESLGIQVALPHFPFQIIWIALLINMLILFSWEKSLLPIMKLHS